MTSNSSATNTKGVETMMGCYSDPLDVHYDVPELP